MTISAASPGRCFLLRWLHAAEIGVQVRTALEGWELLGGGTGGVPWGNWGCVVVPAMQGAAGLGLPCAEQTQQGEGELAQELFSALVCVLMWSNPELSGVPMAVALILGVLLLWVPSCSLLR